jgi:hypothetical protein
MTMVTPTVTSRLSPGDLVRSPESTWGAAPEEGGVPGYVLRLGLSLLLDALLLELGAAAGPVRPELPWRRWLDEDVELALGMAQACRSVDGDLPAALAPPGRALSQEAVLSGLTARYTALAGELTGALDPASGPVVPNPSGPVSEYRTDLGQIRERIHGRLRELDGFRGQGSVPGTPQPHDASEASPGEFLG